MSERLARRDLVRGLCGLALGAGAASAGLRAAAAPLGRAAPVAGGLADCDPGSLRVGVSRLDGNPIVRPHQDPRMGHNVQGPSLIRVPEWIERPLGRYYLYFADHKGSYIRLAYADRVEGPWRTHEPGSLQLSESHFPTADVALPPELAGSDAASAERRAALARSPSEGVPSPLESATLPHIASPDAHVREDRREIVLYYHGLEAFRTQRTRVATSRDGIHFTAREEILGPSYFRVFSHGGWWYAMAMPGILFRSRDGLSGFVQGPTLFPSNMRHSALLVRGDRLFVFWTRVGDAPESILLSTVELGADWGRWRASEPVEVLRPERDWEGADLPVVPSIRDAVNVRVRQLRDPAIFEGDDGVYLLYAVAGESGIAIGHLELACGG